MGVKYKILTFLRLQYLPIHTFSSNLTAVECIGVTALSANPFSNKKWQKMTPLFGYFWLIYRLYQPLSFSTSCKIDAQRAKKVWWRYLQHFGDIEETNIEGAFRPPGARVKAKLFFSTFLQWTAPDRQTIGQRLTRAPLGGGRICPLLVFPE